MPTHTILLLPFQVPQLQNSVTSVLVHRMFVGSIRGCSCNTGPLMQHTRGHFAPHVLTPVPYFAFSSDDYLQQQ